MYALGKQLDKTCLPLMIFLYFQSVVSVDYGGAVAGVVKFGRMPGAPKPRFSGTTRNFI